MISVCIRWCGHSDYLLPVHADWSACMLYQLINILINILNKTLGLEHTMSINNAGSEKHLAIGRCHMEKWSTQKAIRAVMT